MKIKLLNKPDSVSDTTYYYLDLEIEKNGEEHEVSITLVVFQSENMVIPEYEMTIAESPIDFTAEEEEEIKDFAIEHYDEI